jgi:site-specific DNA recombinase
VVVVYKVDRLTRSLADFAKLVELFESHGVSFVAVTQQFNTTTSMGRLTLNVLLSFAQFERELAGERIRDKFAASRAKGMWMGGTVPLGYDVKDRKLLVNPDEADRVRLIFRRYLAIGCVSQLRKDLEQRGVRSKERVLTSGRVLGGCSFGRGALYHLLQNHVYLGEVMHKGVSYPGEQERIVDDDLWNAVQAKVEANRGTRRRSRIETGALLGGLIYDDRGNLMSPTYSVRRGNRYRYYISRALACGSKVEAGMRSRVGADDVERLVVELLSSQLSLPELLKEAESGAGVWKPGFLCGTPSSGLLFAPARSRSSVKPRRLLRPATRTRTAGRPKFIPSGCPPRSPGHGRKSSFRMNTVVRPGE